MKVAFLKKALPFVLFAALVLAIVLYSREAQAESAQPVVVSVWNEATASPIFYPECFAVPSHRIRG